MPSTLDWIIKSSTSVMMARLAPEVALPEMEMDLSVMTAWFWGLMISIDFIDAAGVGVTATEDESFGGVRLLADLLARLIPKRIIPPRMTPIMMAERTSLRIAPRLYTYRLVLY